MNEIKTRLAEAISEYLHHQLTGTRPAMHAATSLVDAADAATLEIERLEKALESAINDADRAIETARRVDGREREALRSALSDLVRIYTIDGAATTPAAEIGKAWERAKSALRKP